MKTFESISSQILKEKYRINTPPIANTIGLTRKSSSSLSSTLNSNTNIRTSNHSKNISFHATDSDHKHKPRQSSIVTHLLDPVVKPHQLRDKDAKRRTDFESESTIIKFIIIVCNSNFSLVKQTVSNQLTWFKEWFVF